MAKAAPTGGRAPAGREETVAAWGGGREEAEPPGLSCSERRELLPGGEPPVHEHVCVHVCTCVHVCVCVCTCVCTRVYRMPVCMCMHVPAHITCVYVSVHCVCTCVHVCICVHTSASCICICVRCVSLYAYVRMCVHT